MFQMNISLQLFLVSLTSFLICFMAIPSIIKIAVLKNLCDEPGERKKHHCNVPTLGGMAIFAGFIFSSTFWASQQEIVELQYIIASLIILFFIGAKDDIVELVAYKKLIAQAMAAVIIVYFANIRITSLYGFFDIYQIPYWYSIIFSVFVVITITNAYNLIDGVDMLSGTIGLITTLSFGSWFCAVGYGQYAILAFSMSGALLAFLYFNRHPAKIFMGDTGSLLLGFINAILAVKFIEFNKVYVGAPAFKIYSVPAVAIGIMIIPLFDTMRVFIIRILKGRSPMSPDRNHIHHILCDRGYSHFKVTAYLAGINILIISNSLYFQRLTGEWLLVMNLSIMFIFSSYHVFHKKRLERNKKNVI